MWKGFSQEQSESKTAADLLCGDSILNYKTVQSLGNEELFVKKYTEYLEPLKVIAIKGHMAMGFSFGMSNFTVFLVFAGLFYFGGIVMENNPTINPADVFLAIFGIFMGASHVGTAMSFGPDVAKASVAADKVFKIIDVPSKINAVDQDKKTEEFISADGIDGIIEFKDVWFRYPSRKEDFVLRGLNIKINPNETVALVGESGCGKSTFVSLLMRFYDVDFGEILIDGINIKKYNLHSLRKKISLVMQEPSIFNYSILENVLYGNLNASNSDVLNATTMANCTDFIESESLRGTSESPKELLDLMELKKDAIVALIG